MAKKSKAYREAIAKVPSEAVAPLEAMKVVKEVATKKFDETVEVHFRLGIDTRQADQQLRGTVSLPNGSGKTVRVAVFAEGAMAEAAKEAGTAFVFMGHGTAHVAKVSYSQMSAQMQNLGYENVFIGTVEGEPEETSCESVIEAVKAAGYTNVILRPLMVVAGDHANNDMAGSDDDSWKTMFEAADFTVDCQIAGLGEIADIQALYIAHTQAAIDALNA